ncbi:MAG: aspartate/glutamate racemase family protein [Acetobacteraceae bacterium]|nr:aspartate/glutamate racemase family protein [Acetobacteraceae bacterium]
MRLLLANANTTHAITLLCAEAARRAASPGTEIIPATPAFGPAVISSRAEDAIAAHGLLDLLARHAGEVDAVLLAVSLDTALEAARQLMPCPVVGMTEAACFTACLLGTRFGLVTFGGTGAYRDRIAQHGLASRCASLVGVAATPQAALADPAAADRLILEGIETAVAEGAEAVVMGGAALAGAAGRLQARSGVPLVDGIEAGVRLAEALAAMRPAKPRTGGLAPLAGRDSTGLSPALAALLRGG